MKSVVLLAALALALFAGVAVEAQRITGDQACVSSCYDISVAVIRCPDLTDPGVISCICPNSTQVATLNSCHDCINSLSGITDTEKTSINTLYGACANGGSTSSSSSSSSSSASSSGTLAGAATSAASGAAAATTSPAASSDSSNNKPNGAAHTTLGNPASLLLVSTILAAALGVTYA